MTEQESKMSLAQPTVLKIASSAVFEI